MPKLLQILLVAVFALVGASAFVPSTAIKTRGATAASVESSRLPSHITTSLSMAGPATLEPTKTEEKKKTEEPIKDEQKQGSEGWEVRLFNDPMNKREYVARCLTEIVGLSDGLAYQVMMQAHQFGLAAIIRCHQERAELYRDTLVEHGLVVDMVPVDDDE